MRKIKFLGLSILWVVLWALPAGAIFFSEELNFSLPQTTLSLPSSEFILPPEKGENLLFSFPQTSPTPQSENLPVSEPINFSFPELSYPVVPEENSSLIKGLSAEERILPGFDFPEMNLPMSNKKESWEKIFSSEKKDLIAKFLLVKVEEDKNLSPLEKKELIKLILYLFGYPLEKELYFSEPKTSLPEISYPALSLERNNLSGLEGKIQEFLQRNESLVLKELKEFGLPGTTFYAKEIFPYLPFQKQKEVIKRMLEMEKEASPLEKKLIALTSVQILELVNKKEIEELMEVVVNNLDAYEGNFLFFDLRGEKGVWDNLLKNGIKEIAEVWKNSGVILAVVSTASGIFFISSLASLPFVGFIPKEVMSFEEFLRLVTKAWLESQKPLIFPFKSKFPFKGMAHSGGYVFMILIFLWLSRKKIYALLQIKENRGENMAKILIKAKPVSGNTHPLSPATRRRINDLEEDIEKRLKRTKYWASYLRELKSNK